MQTVYAAPAVPMNTMMATPMATTIAAPSVGTVTVAAPTAAPTMASYVAPPAQAVVQRPSYVPPPGPPVATTVMSAPVLPGTMPLPATIPMPQAPGGPPPKLTAGIPDPAQIEKQKLAYAAGLDKQLNDAIATVQNETRIEKEMVAFRTQKDIALYETQIDEKLVEQLAVEDERAAITTCQLRKATVDQNIALNNQAASLVMDYNMKVARDDIAAKKRAFEQAYVTQELKLAQDFNATAMKAGAMPMPVQAPMYAAPPTVVAAPPTVVV